jgi:hypothetical protein
MYAQITTAWALKKAFPELTLHIVSDAGHSSREPGIAKILVQVCLSMLFSSVPFLTIAIRQRTPLLICDHTVF